MGDGDVSKMAVHQRHAGISQRCTVRGREGWGGDREGEMGRR